VKILLSSICLESGTDIQLALYYIQSYLLKRDTRPRRSLEVRVRVFTEDIPLTVIVKQILSQRPEVVGFSCYLWNIKKILLVCRELKRKNIRMKIVLGGPEVTPRAEEILAQETSVDIVVRGEGEAAFADLATAFFRPLGLQGISFRDGGKIITNPARHTLRHLHGIPSPYLSGLIDLKTKHIIDVPLETMRGCSYRCGYCYYHKNFPHLRYFSLSRIRKELQYILARKPREVYLMDATFNSHPQRAKKILRMFIRYNKVSNLHVELKAEFVDDEMAFLLRRANAFNIEIGLQSTNPETLRAISRPLDKKKFKAGIGLLNKYKLIYEIQLIDALPFQGYEDLMDSLDWLYSLHPIKVLILPLAVLAGTRLRQQAVSFGISYDRQAPYVAYKTRHMPAVDMVKVEKLRFAMERLYDSQVFQKTLYALQEKAGIKISAIFNDWILWEGKIKQQSRRYPDLLNSKLPEFLRYVCQKEAKSSFYELLLPGLESTLAEYRLRYQA
jgi:radical SAM superfamily enzyme YgiQ (UPF0313 family)